MSGGADALLKGMLGIGITSDDKKSPTSANGVSVTGSGSSGKNETPSAVTAAAAAGGGGSKNKKKKSQSATPPPGKTSRGKPGRGSGHGTIASGQADGGDVDGAVAEKSEQGANNGNVNKKKKKKNSAPANPANAQGGKAGGGKKVTTPSASEKVKSTKENYAWSAFQSSPDPSTLPDIGGLFGGDAKRVAGEPEHEKDDREEKNSEDDAGGDDEEKVAASPPHAGISAGEELLQQLASPERRQQQQPHGNNADVGEAKVNKMFRTMESVELEMLSPLKNETEGKDDKTKEKSADDNSKDDEVAAVRSETTHVSDGALSQQEIQAKFQFPDPIMELMNPGGDPGGFGMHHPQMPYNPPLHYPPQHQYPPMQYQYPGYPYPHQMMHQPPPSAYSTHHHPPNNIPPGFTTLQVRVPNILGPGNTMMVHGMPITVPEGIPPGAIIPVMIPIHPPPGHHHNPNNHYPEQYGGPNYYYHQQQHFMQHHHHPHQVPQSHGMMREYNYNNLRHHTAHNQQLQEQNQQSQSLQQQSQHQQAQLPQSYPNSWASKVGAATTPSKAVTDPKIHPQLVVPTPPAAVASTSASRGKGTRGINPPVIHASKTKKDENDLSAAEAAATAAARAGTVVKSKNEGMVLPSKKSGKKKQQQKEISGGSSEGNKDESVVKKKSGRK